MACSRQAAPARSTRLIFLNRFFHPDQSATSQILSDLAFFLAASGADVHVITSRQLYHSPRASLPREELVNQVRVHRVATTRFGRTGLFGRGIDYVSYYGSMWSRARSLVDCGDVLIAKTDPPLTSVIAFLVAREKKARLVNWLQDMYPEAAAELGVPLMQGLAGRSLRHLRDLSLRGAARNVVVSDEMAQHVRMRGMCAERVHVIPNWTKDEEICPVGRDQNPLRAEWGLQRDFVIGYSGNLGRAHEFETVLSAADQLRDRSDIVFVFISGGYQFDLLARAVEERNLQQRFRFFQYQRPELLKYSLNLPDVHLISLKPELEGLIMPSKFYGIAAVGRPIISITSSKGEIARLVRQHDCGLVIEPGNGRALAEALILLADSPARMAKMGQRARAMLDGHFARRHALGRWQELLAPMLRPN
jgi:glycosyltransferase involved in cell wall biosynthesis